MVNVCVFEFRSATKNAYIMALCYTWLTFFCFLWCEAWDEFNPLMDIEYGTVQEWTLKGTQAHPFHIVSVRGYRPFFDLIHRTVLTVC